MRTIITIPAGTILRHVDNGGERVPVTAQKDIHVDITVDMGGVRALALKAARNAGGRAKSGPVTAKVRK